MNLKELKKSIDNSQHKNWAYEKSLKLRLTIGGYDKNLIGFIEIYQFFNKEFSKWSKEEKEITWTPLKESIAFISTIQNHLVQCLNSIVADHPINVLQRSWAEIERLCHNKALLIYLRDFDETQFLLDLQIISPQYIFGANEFFSNRFTSVLQSNDINQISGALLGYEFRTENLAILINRKNAERKSINKLKNELTSVVSELERKKLEFTSDLDSEFDLKRDEIENLKSDLLIVIKDFEKKSQEDFNEIIEGSNKRFKEQEKTYQELLMLKEPAEYWDQRACELKKSANKWLCLAGVSSIIGLVLFTILALSLSVEHISSQIKNPAVSIRWSLLSLLAVALIVFLVRTFTKLTMSAYHLYRDAQERKQLTYLYLALKHESNVSDGDRHIILQSLFSRSDTGLLKEDSGPTMPLSSIDKFNQH